MRVEKQKTVNGDKYELVKDETYKSGKEFEYYLKKNGRIATDPVYTKRDAMSQFRGVTDRAEEGDDKLNVSYSPSVPAFDEMADGDGSMPQSTSEIPGLGMSTDEDQDDDSDPLFPF